jgi:periplasmic divalent cation tolerance protein
VSALIWCPFADEASAAEVANRLLDERLIACANILGPMRSIYAWDGKRGDETEVGVLFKTDAAVLDQAVLRLTELHPYETPAVLGWRVDVASKPTAEWLWSAVRR